MPITHYYTRIRSAKLILLQQTSIKGLTFNGALKSYSMHVFTLKLMEREIPTKKQLPSDIAIIQHRQLHIVETTGAEDWPG